LEAKMENIIQTIRATSVSDKEIVLTNVDDLMKVYGFIKDNTNFVFTWDDGNAEISRLMIASSLLAKIENNEIILSARKEKGGK